MNFLTKNVLATFSVQWLPKAVKLIGWSGQKGTARNRVHDDSQIVPEMSTAFGLMGFS